MCSCSVHPTRKREPDMKPFWKSKTLWANGLALLVVAGDAVLGTRLLSPEQGDMLIIGLAVVNAGLRLVTNKGVTL